MNKISGFVEFDSQDKIYEDHFPGNPIVPGTLIINSFVEILKVRLKKEFQVEKFRFKKFLKPKKYEYVIEVKGDKFKCSILEDKRKIVQGIICN